MGFWLPPAGPDGPSCLADLFSLDDRGVSSRGGAEGEQEQAAARLRCALGPALRSLYLASPTLQATIAYSTELGRASTRQRSGRLTSQGRAPGPQQCSCAEAGGCLEASLLDTICADVPRCCHCLVLQALMAMRPPSPSGLSISSTGQLWALLWHLMMGPHTSVTRSGGTCTPAPHCGSCLPHTPAITSHMH
jgi:hypothetical protein